MPRYGSDGDQLSRLQGFVLLALAQLVPSWSCTPGARVLVRNVQVLLCLAQRILNGFVSLCEPRGHVEHWHTAHMESAGAVGAVSSLCFSALSTSQPLAALAPGGCRAVPWFFAQGAPAGWAWLLPQDKVLTVLLQAWDPLSSQGTGDVFHLPLSVSLHAGTVQSRAVGKLGPSYEQP